MSIGNGNESRIYKTTDTGNDAFSVTNHACQVSYHTIAFADAHHGWSVGRKGLILKFEGTVPGGTSLKK